KMKLDDIPPEEGSAQPPTKEPAKVSKKPAKKKSPAKKPAGKSKAKAKPAKAKGNSVSRINGEAKVTKTGKENPFREGSGSYKRVELVLKNSGKTAGTILKMAGMKATTLATCKRLGLIRIEA